MSVLNVNKASVLSVADSAYEKLQELKQCAIAEGVPPEETFGKYSAEASNLGRIYTAATTMIGAELLYALKIVSLHGEIPEDEFVAAAKSIQAELHENIPESAVQALNNLGVEFTSNPDYVKPE